MMQPLQIFAERLYSEWLPSFCDTRDAEFQEDGFVKASLTGLSEYDAEWFLRAIDIGFLSQKDGFFCAQRSKAKEQIFWSGRKGKTPRPLTLWLEPVITIGACARLIEIYGWPSECVGMQSPYPWAFDLVCYKKGTDGAIVAGEVKKSDSEISALIEKMKKFLAQDKFDPIDLKGVEKNSYRKVRGLQTLRPKFFWVVGPNQNEQLFKVSYSMGTERPDLRPVTIPTMKYLSAA